MTEFIEQIEALGRLKDELDRLKAGNEVIAAHERTARSALDTSQRIATANHELAERMTLVADQLEHTATTVGGQFNMLQAAVASTTQDYRSVLSDLKQLDVVRKINATEKHLGEMQQTLSYKFLEAETMTLKTQQQITEQRDEINRLNERLAQSHQAQLELRQQLETVRKTAKNSSSYAIVTLVVQIGLLVLFALLLVFVVMRIMPG